MDEIREEFNRIWNDDVVRVIVSNPVTKDGKYRKATVTQTTVKGKSCYQLTCYTEKQAFQENLNSSQARDKVLELFPTMLCQLSVESNQAAYEYKVTKKGKLLKNKRMGVTPKVSAKATDGHNRVKNYILKEGMQVPALVDMGIFTKEGKIVRTMYDKFKQINRFVELVDDVLKNNTASKLHIIDFGCGKSYLTFILYYYLVELKKRQVQIVGLDLKEDVIKHCNETAKRYGYKNLQFELGDINGYKTDMPIDMVVSLHACDTATDYALANAVNWNAQYILSVPCCQHELNGQIQCDALSPMMKHGIIKERMAALATDAIRANMLEYRGYRTQVIEFVDIEHSPKNLLIRAVKSNISKEKRMQARAEAQATCELLQVKPTICTLLDKDIWFDRKEGEKDE